MKNETTGKKLQVLMSKKGVSLADLAYRIGRSRVDVAKWYFDMVELTDSDIRNIAGVLRITKNELIGLLN